MCIFIWCVVSCRCRAHFRPISCAISRPFPNIHPSHVALLFNPKSSPYMLLLAIQSSHFVAIVTVALFVVVSRLSTPTQLALRSRVFCRCFAYKVGFAPAAPTFELCSSTRHFAFVRPMFSDLSLRITQSRRNAQLNWLTFVWTPACCRCWYPVGVLFSVCYFVFGLAIALIGVAMNSVFGFVTFQSL